MSAGSSFRVLERITAIFELLGQNDGIGISELAARTGLPKSTVSRLVSGLVRKRYLERDGTAVHLGLGLFELGQIAETPRRLRSAAMPVMSRLSRATGGTVELAVRDGDDMVCVAVARGSASRIVAAPVGSRIPARFSLLGSAVSAGTVVMRARAPKNADGAPDEATAGIAMPLYPSSAGVAAAICISGAADLVDTAQWSKALDDARQEIARQEIALREIALRSDQTVAGPGADAGPGLDGPPSDLPE